MLKPGGVSVELAGAGHWPDVHPRPDRVDVRRADDFRCLSVCARISSELRTQVHAKRLFVGAPPRGEAFRASAAGIRGGAPLPQDGRNATDVCDSLSGFHPGCAYKNAGHCPALCVRLRAQAACDSAWLRARFRALNRARKLAVVRFSSMPMPCRARPPLTRSSM